MCVFYVITCDMFYMCVFYMSSHVTCFTCDASEKSSLQAETIIYKTNLSVSQISCNVSNQYQMDLI